MVVVHENQCADLDRREAQDCHCNVGPLCFVFFLPGLGFTSVLRLVV